MSRRIAYIRYNATVHTVHAIITAVIAVELFVVLIIVGFFFFIACAFNGRTSFLLLKYKFNL